jgi:CubicO group peptidase (beta-lactamase class C family)
MSYKAQLTCRRFSLFIPYLLFCLPVFSQPNFDAVDQLLKQNQKVLGNFVVLVSKDGKTIYQKQGGSDFTSRSQAPIAGSGDWMTAALVMTFVDEGKLSLDDKVAKYIPIFGSYMKGYITIRNCLTNTTGIRTDETMEKPLERNHFEDLEQMVNTYANKHAIASNPGTEVFYSSLGPNIAARVLEVISKKAFERLMRERITSPLKMRGTIFSNELGGATNPSNGGQSTANDYINFMTMLLNKGTFEGKRILSEKAVEELEKVQFANLPVKYMPAGLQGAHMGLGCYIPNTNSSGAATSFVSPGLFGTAAFLDTCRNYGAVIILEKPMEEKKPLYQNLMNLIGEAIGGACN